MIKIPKKIIKRSGCHIKRTYHYELVRVYEHHVLYRCLENGTYESFSKKDFIVRKCI